ncbi:hypothetical protein CWS02_09855 [Enterobacter sp. EA-1]|nr:hypothetical protein CWS02_09855 [Enterobacter sp. EA-1]
MSGKLYALSTGPGAADLITVRGARILGNWMCSMPRPGARGRQPGALHRAGIPWRTDRRALLPFPMSADSAEKEAVWDEVAAALDAQAGKQVGFITLGDAMLFSTWCFVATSATPGTRRDRPPA